MYVLAEGLASRGKKKVRYLAVEGDVDVGGSGVEARMKSRLTAAG